MVAIGTAAFREAPNGARAVEIAAKLGIPMEIATEQRESELAYLVGSLGQDGYAVIDNGSRSIELVSREGRAPRYLVFNLGYRLAYEMFFAATEDPEAATLAFRDQLRQEALKAPFMKGKKKLVGVEFGEMADLLFPPAPLEGRVFTLQELKQKLHEITTSANQRVPGPEEEEGHRSRPSAARRRRLPDRGVRLLAARADREGARHRPHHRGGPSRTRSHRAFTAEAGSTFSITPRNRSSALFGSTSTGRNPFVAATLNGVAWLRPSVGICTIRTSSGPSMRRSRHPALSSVTVLSADPLRRNR